MKAMRRAHNPAGGWAGLAAVGAVALLVLVGLLISVVNEHLYRERKVQYLMATAEVLAMTVEPALVFDDVQAAQEYVDALKANPEIRFAEVRNVAGARVAAYGSKAQAAKPPGGVMVSASINHEGSVIGRIDLATAGEPIATVLGRHGGLGLLAAMAVLMLSVFGVSQRSLGRANRESTARAAELAEANTQLREQEERREHAEEALRQSQKMEAMGQLTGGIAHDFNNLLQVVHGNLQMIGRHTTDDRLRRWASNGAEAAERGARLTAQLLAFSREQKLQLRPVWVSEVVPRLRDLLSSTLGPTIQLSFEFADDSLCVIADPTQLELAILNLAINARDAMANGGRLRVIGQPVSVIDDPELERGDYVALSVIDEGPGMPETVKTRAFDPFFTTKGVGKGTGLGLAQVYGIAKQAGGVARIKSVVGEGTTVTLLLPRVEGEVAKGQAVGKAAPRASKPGTTILVVDDDRGVRDFVREALQSLGYEVIAADDGEEGLAVLEIHNPDLAIIDFAMPGLNGAEVASRALARRPDLKILFASGYADTEALNTVGEASARVLLKPFDVDTLAEAVARILEPKA